MRLILIGGMEYDYGTRSLGPNLWSRQYSWIHPTADVFSYRKQRQPGALTASTDRDVALVSHSVHNNISITLTIGLTCILTSLPI